MWSSEPFGSQVKLSWLLLDLVIINQRLFKEKYTCNSRNFTPHHLCTSTRTVPQYDPKVSLVLQQEHWYLSLFWKEIQRHMHLRIHLPDLSTVSFVTDLKYFVHITPKKFINAALFLRLGLSFTLIRHENASFFLRLGLPSTLMRQENAALHVFLLCRPTVHTNPSLKRGSFISTV